MKLRKIFNFAIGPVVGAILGVVTLPIITWFFSAQDVGRLALLQVVLNLGVSLFSLEMHQSYVREYNEVDNKASLFKMALLPGISFLSAATFLILIYPQSISELVFAIESHLISGLIVSAIWSMFLINFFSHTLRMQERGLAFSSTQIAPKFLFLVLVIILLKTSEMADLSLLVISHALSVYFSLVVFMYLTYSVWNNFFTEKIDRKKIREMLSFSLPLVLGGISYWGLTTMDRFFIKTMSGFEELAVFSISVTLAGAVSVVSTVFSSMWHPLVYKWIKTEVDQKKLQSVIEGMTILVVSIWAFVGLFSWILPIFFPTNYKIVEYLIIACVALPLFYMLSETTVVGIGITRRTNFAMFASVAAFLTNALLNFMLVPKFGATGAAIASVISFFLFFIIRTEASARLWKPFPRLKIYLLLTLYVISTIFVVVNQFIIAHHFFIWVFLLLLTGYLFEDRVFYFFIFLKKFLFKIESK